MPTARNASWSRQGLYQSVEALQAALAGQPPISRLAMNNLLGNDS